MMKRSSQLIYTVSVQQKARRCASQEGDNDNTRGAQTTGQVQTVAGAHNDNILNDNNGNGWTDRVRAFRIRIGGEELVVISTQAWDPNIMGKLPNSQRKILRRLMLGKKQKEVADELGIQTQTVSNATNALYKREDGLADTLEQLVSKLCPPLFKIKPE